MEKAAEQWMKCASVQVQVPGFGCVQIAAPNASTEHCVKFTFETENNEPFWKHRVADCEALCVGQAPQQTIAVAVMSAAG
jgi:hypothetical protein